MFSKAASEMSLEKTSSAKVVLIAEILSVPRQQEFRTDADGTVNSLAV
jgi:hypothetical protein